MAAPAVDVGYIAASYAVPETNIQSLLSEPTVELVQSLLVQIEAKAREYDDLQSEKLRADIENEAAVRAGEARARTLQATAEKAVKDAEELRQQLARKETAHQQLEAQLQTIQANTSSSSSQIDVLEARVRSLESQNRDTVALHEAKSAAYDRLAEELSTQHQKLVALRKQVSELEDKKQELEAGAKDVTFRENNLRQEIDQLRSSNEWYEGELKMRSADNTRFRKEKNSQIAELQRINADATQTIDSLRSKETSQTKRIEELEQRIEQSLLRTQQLQEEAAQTQQSFRAELDNSRRLVELSGEKENTIKKRLDEVNAELQDVKDAAAFEVGKLQAECDSEKSKAVHYEEKVAELELLVETQESQLSELRNPVHVPQTPRRGMNGAFSTPARAGSPMISTPGGSKSGLTMTQLYAENVKLKSDLRKAEDATKDLRALQNEMLDEIEKLSPQLEELKNDNERLNAEFDNMSGDLSDAHAEKEAARKEARKKEGDIQGLKQRLEINRQVITDITFQNKLLLLEQRRVEAGYEALSPEELRFLEETKDNTIPDHYLDQNDTPTSRSLTRNLVLYKNVAQLVQRNHDLLEQVANFTQVYEGRQAQEKLEEQERIKRELAESQEEALQYADRINSLGSTVNLLTKERDMWRRTATTQGHRRAGSDAASIFDGTPPPPGSSIAHKESAEIVQNSSLFKELQKSLDMIREESNADLATLKKQRDDLTNQIHKLQHENVRLESKQSVSQQWHDQQQHRIDALESQKELLQKRLDAAQDQLASSDLKFQQVMEENIECRGQLESLERANTNLKASQSLWETTRSRLEGEIRTLNEAKGLLSKSLEEKRNDYNEQSLMQAENRRLLESRASSLEVELSNVQRKLQDEMDEYKRITMRLELDQTDKQRKIDDLLKAANEVRQELSSVRTARDQLQVRVSELQTDLRLAEERTQQTPRANSTVEAEEGENGISHEEQLKVQLADLQRNHDRAKEKLETAETHIETYKNIAQEKEEQLESFVEAHDQMEQDLNRTLQEKESEIVDLKKRVEEFSSELATTSTELSNLRSSQEHERLELTQQKEALEADIARIQSDVKEYEAAMETQKQLVVSQAEIAKRAQADYENELSKHGETMKTLRAIRDQFNTLSTEVTQYKTEAEAARVSLSQNEEHWTAVKERQDRELREIREEKDGLNGQNKTLYEQIDTLNKTIKTLQDNRLSVAGGQADAINLDSSLNGLQELNRSLRNDKDILQLKVNGMELEVQRVRQELATKQEQLERANEKLLQAQSQSQNRPSDAKFKALEESVGQLNLYRESNTTLRNDILRLEAERTQKDKELETLHAQLQPLQSRVLESEGELEFTSGQLKTVEEDRERWQKRHQDVLQRYDRIDPKELEDLKQQIETLKTERDQASQQVGEGFKERLKAAEEEAAKYKAEAEALDKRRAKVVQDARESLGKLKAEIKEAKEQLANTQAELASVREELLLTRRERDELQAKITASADVVMEEEGQVAESNTGLSVEDKEQLEARVKEAEDRERQQTNEAANLGFQLEETRTRERTLEGQIAELQQRVDDLAKEAQDARDDKARADAQVVQLQSQQAHAQHEQPAEATSSSVELQRLKEELAAREKEVEDLRTQAEIAESHVDNVEEAGAKQDVELPTEELAAEKDALEERKSALEEREAALAKAEAELQQRKAEVEATQSADPSRDEEKATMQAKMERMKQKANEMVRTAREEEKKALEEKNVLQEEVNQLRKEVEQLRAEVEQLKQAPPASALPGSDAPDLEVKNFIHQNKVVQEIIQRNVRTKVEQKMEEVTASIRAEEQQMMVQKIEEVKAAEKSLSDSRNTVKLSMSKNRLDNMTAKWNVVVAAAKETPEKPVKEVFDVASVATKPPAEVTKPEPTTASATVQNTQPQAPAATAQPASIQPTSATTTAPGSATSGPQQPQGPVGAGSQANGSNTSAFGQLGSNQPGFGHPFSQSVNQGMNQGLNQSQFGFGSQQQGGFGAPNPFLNQQHTSRPNSPFGQLQLQMQPHMQPQQTMQPYQAPRGGQNTRGQSNIPRPGSGIPVPGGGRGRGGPQVPMPLPNAGAQANQQQFGRGGGAGRGQGGRGRGQQPGSPMNPGANMFVPGGPGNKGQKRGPEDDGTQQQQQQHGKKRHRGGRGGGGAGGDGGDGAAAE